MTTATETADFVAPEAATWNVVNADDGVYVVAHLDAGDVEDVLVELHVTFAVTPDGLVGDEPLRVARQLVELLRENEARRS